MPEPEGQQPGDQQSKHQKPGDQQPNQPNSGGSQEQNFGKQPPPDAPLLEVPLPASYARWGLLPPRLQEALRSSSASDVPLRYRRWLEQYHLRGGTPQR